MILLHVCYAIDVISVKEDDACVGIPKEIEPKEGRVGLIATAAGELVKHGSEIYLQGRHRGRRRARL